MLPNGLSSSHIPRWQERFRQNSDHARLPPEVLQSVSLIEHDRTSSNTGGIYWEVNPVLFLTSSLLPASSILMSFVHSRDGGPSYFRLCRYDHLYLRLCHGLHCRHMGTCHASFRKGRHIQWFGNRKENCWHWLLKGFIFSFLGFVWIKVDAVVNTVKSYQIAFIYMQQADVMTGTAMVAALWAGTSVESRLRALNVANKLSVHARFSSIAWHCSDWCKSALAFSLPSPVLDSYCHIAYLIGLLTCIVHCVHFPSRAIFSLFPETLSF